jgi:hypothetical protein
VPIAAAICLVDLPSAYIATIRSRIRIGRGSIAETYRKRMTGAIGKRALL